MPRRKKCRMVQGPPCINGFKPKGVPSASLERVIITLDEFESIRLADYEKLEHEAASEKIGVSRSVFTRLLDGARKKVAQALIEGCELTIEGGEYHFQRKVFRCNVCFFTFDTGMDKEDPKSCPSCHSTALENLNTRFGQRGRCHRHGL